MSAWLDEDQRLFQSSVDRFLLQRNTPARVRSLMDDPLGFDTEAWTQLAEELGLTALLLPESLGGAAASTVELGMVLERMGYHLYAGPYLGSAVLATTALLLGADAQQQARLLPRLADGGQRAALLLTDLNAPRARPESLRCEMQADGFRVSGTLPLVVDAEQAQLLLLVLPLPSGPTLALLESGEGVERTPLNSLDSTRRLCRVELRDALARPIGPLGGFPLQEAWAHWSLALAHESVGLAQRLLDSTLEYMQVRVQFGRTIASFQALKHRVADLFVDLELAKAATFGAAASLAARPDELAPAFMAKALAGDCAMSVGQAAIQLRGGIGFTWEEDTHLWFRRAKSSEVLLGTSDRHRDWFLAAQQHADVQQEAAAHG